MNAPDPAEPGRIRRGWRGCVQAWVGAPVSPGRPLRFEYLCFAPRGAYRLFACLPVVHRTSGSAAGPSGPHRARRRGISPRGSPLPVAPRRSLLDTFWVPPGISLSCSQTPPTSSPGSSTPCRAMARSAWMPARNTTNARTTVSAAGVARCQAPGGANGLPTGANVRRATPAGNPDAGGPGFPPGAAPKLGSAPEVSNNLEAGLMLPAPARLHSGSGVLSSSGRRRTSPQSTCSRAS